MQTHMLDAWKVPRHIGESKMVLHRLHTAQDSMRPIRCVRALVSMHVMVGEEKEWGGGGQRESTQSMHTANDVVRVAYAS